MDIDDGVAHLQGPCVHDVLDSEPLHDGPVRDGGVRQELPQRVLYETVETLTFETGKANLLNV